MINAEEKMGNLKHHESCAIRAKRDIKKGINDEKRDTFRIEYGIEQRPEEANNRKEIGHWEADTVAGKKGSVCFTTSTDRKSRFLMCRKTKKRKLKKR